MGTVPAAGATTTEEIAALEEMARRIRVSVIRTVKRVKVGHVGGPLSAADILAALYGRILRIRPDEPDWPDRDRFILSKGHACPVWYSALAEKGFFEREELLTLRQMNGRLQGHPDRLKTPGVDMTTGSLGQGLSAGVGMALGLRLQGKPARVYVMLGDGELNEGQVWEAALVAAKYKLDNLLAFVDYNNLQLDGTCDEVMPIEPLVDKWQAFNWAVLETDGNHMRQVVETIQRALAIKGQPTVIIARTVKGKGVSYMENDCDWHGRPPDDEQFAQAMAELDALEQRGWRRVTP